MCSTAERISYFLALARRERSFIGVLLGFLGERTKCLVLRVWLYGRGYNDRVDYLPVHCKKSGSTTSSFQFLRNPGL